MFKPNPLIYLINAYTSHEVDRDIALLEQENRANLEAYIGGALKKKYKVTTILPIAQSSAMSRVCSFGTGFAEWQQDDFTYISKCDAVWVLMSDGWKISTGVSAEIAFALKHKIPVKYLNPINLELYDSPTSGILTDYKL